MPRSAVSPVGRILSFFRSADLDSANLVLDLCKDAVGERRQKSEQAKVRALGGVKVKRKNGRRKKSKAAEAAA